MLSGFPVVYGIKPLLEEAVPSHQLGSIGVTGDGRKFRYAKFGEALTAGHLLQAPVEITTDQGLVVYANAAIGATQVTLTLAGTAVTANEYGDGYFTVTTTPGLGYSYKIKSHPAQTSTTGNVVITLYDPLVVALTTASRVDLVKNPYNGVIDNPISATSSIAGVAMLAGTSGYYGWIQVGGPGVVLADASGACTVGALLTASNQTAGSVEDGDSDSLAIVGVALSGIAQSEYGTANLCIE